MRCGLIGVVVAPIASASTARRSTLRAAAGGSIQSSCAPPVHTVGERGEGAREVAPGRRGERRVLRDPVRRVAEVDDLRVTEHAEAEPEVERRPRDEHEIGLLQRDRTRAGEGELVIRRAACPRPIPFANTGTRAASAHARSGASARSQ